MASSDGVHLKEALPGTDQESGGPIPHVAYDIDDIPDGGSMA